MGSQFFQTVVRGPLVVRDGSSGGPRGFARLSADSFEERSNAKIVSDTERLKDVSILVCATTVFVGWPSTESRRISSFNNFLY
jgi:hypothetical protein